MFLLDSQSKTVTSHHNIISIKIHIKYMFIYAKSSAEHVYMLTIGFDTSQAKRNKHLWTATVSVYIATLAAVSVTAGWGWGFCWLLRYCLSVAMLWEASPSHISHCCSIFWCADLAQQRRYHIWWWWWPHSKLIILNNTAEWIHKINANLHEYMILLFWLEFNICVLFCYVAVLRTIIKINCSTMHY